MDNQQSQQHQVIASADLLGSIQELLASAAQPPSPLAALPEPGAADATRGQGQLSEWRRRQLATAGPTAAPWAPGPGRSVEARVAAICAFRVRDAERRVAAARDRLRREPRLLGPLETFAESDSRRKRKCQQVSSDDNSRGESKSQDGDKDSGGGVKKRTRATKQKQPGAGSKDQEKCVCVQEDEDEDGRAGTSASAIARAARAEADAAGADGEDGAAHSRAPDEFHPSVCPICRSRVSRCVSMELHVNSCLDM